MMVPQLPFRRVHCQLVSVLIENLEAFSPLPGIIGENCRSLPISLCSCCISSWGRYRIREPEGKK